TKDRLFLPRVHLHDPQGHRGSLPDLLDLRRRRGRGDLRPDAGRACRAWRAADGPGDGVAEWRVDGLRSAAPYLERADYGPRRECGVLRGDGGRDGRVCELVTCAYDRGAR